MTAVPCRVQRRRTAGWSAERQAVALWHGGIDGLKAGDLIVPSPPKLVDGCAICAAHASGKEVLADGHVIDPRTGRPDRVYVTSDREYARFYASKWVLGDLYRVEPVGAVEWSTEDPFPTWIAGSARVVAVYERAVRLTDGQRRALLRRWPNPGEPGWPTEPAAGGGELLEARR